MTTNKNSFETQIEEKFDAVGKEIETWVENIGCFKVVENFFEAYFAILFNILWLVLINTFWDDINFITQDFKDLLIFINVAGVVSILTYMGLLIMPLNPLKRLVKIINNTFSIIVLWKMYDIFPFEFGEKVDFLNTVTKPILIIFVVLTVLDTLRLLISSKKI